MRELAKDEMKRFWLVWMTIIISLSYCHSLSKFTKKGVFRFVAILPVVSLFLYLPLNLTSIHLTCATSFFVTWLSTFKLILFSLGRGPLSSSSLSLSHFITFACLPIKPQIQINNAQPPLNYILKAILLAFMLKFERHIHPNIQSAIYFFHIYFLIELFFALIATIAKGFLGIQLEPQFNEPLLSSSLQDFWGKRWNLMVTRILRPTVYHPVLEVSTRLVGRERAALPAVMSTFVVSGVIHELIFYYLMRVRPAFEVTAFFVLHGLCLCVEIVVKKAIGGAWKLPRVVSGVATVIFVMGTGQWLLLPPLLREGLVERAFQEYAVVAAFFSNLTNSIIG